MARDDAGDAGRGEAWAPLRIKVYRALWVAQLASNLGSWMQTVGAQWLLIGHGALAVTMVQAASGLPVLVLALPAGVLADLVDRRRVLLAVQIGLTVLAGVLAVVTILGRTGAGFLLAVTFLMGCCTAVSNPAWQAIQPALVPRSQIAQASALGSTSVNAARAVGPAIGGLVVAAAGAGWTFALNAVSFLGIAYVLWRWKPSAAAQPPRDAAGREHARQALRAGGRYVRHAPGVRHILARAALFAPPAAALWSLLPVVAHRTLGLGSGGYGLLLGAVGVGAVLGAWRLPRLRRGLGNDRVLAGSTVAFAGVLVVLVVSRSALMSGAALVVAGVAWIGALSTLNSAMQLRLPNWVRARGLGFYLIVFQGSQAVAAFVWGAVATWMSVDAALAIAAAALAGGCVVGVRFPVASRADTGNEVPENHWPEPVLVFEPAPDDGPVLVTVEYRIRPGDEAAFTEAMEHVERSRRRTGAVSWGLWQDGADLARFVETFTVSSWSEHLAQHHGRYTGADVRIEQRAAAFLTSPPVVSHAVSAAAGPAPLRADISGVA